MNRKRTHRWPAIQFSETHATCSLCVCEVEPSTDCLNLLFMISLMFSMFECFKLVTFQLPKQHDNNTYSQDNYYQLDPV